MDGTRCGALVGTVAILAGAVAFAGLAGAAAGGAAAAGVLLAAEVEEAEASTVATPSVSSSYSGAPTSTVSSLECDSQLSIEQNENQHISMVFNLHFPKKLCDNSINVGFDIHGNLVCLNQGNNISLLNHLSNLYRPFDNCALKMRKIVEISSQLQPENARTAIMSQFTSVIESPIVGTLMVFISNTGEVHDRKPRKTTEL